MASAASSAFQASLSNELSINNIDTTKRVLDLSTTTKVTFWGKRVVVSDFYNGSYSLARLARQMLKLANERCQKDDLTTEERLIGIGISNKLNEFYEETDRQVKQRNFLTRFFVFLREYSFSRNTTRFCVENNFIYKRFSAYSETNYKEIFGEEKIGDPPKYKYQIASRPDKIAVSEETIRKFFPRVEV